MTMRFKPNTSITSASGHIKVLFEWFDFMRQASPTGPGWTVPRSSDGVTVVTDGSGSNITSFSDLAQWVSATSISWFVLRSPDGAKEIMWSRLDGTIGNWQVRISPGALFIGGTIDIIPTGTDAEFFHQNEIQGTDSAIIHMGADDAAPYGFWLWSHQIGNFTVTRAGWAYIPVTATPAADPDPYVHFMINWQFGGEFTLTNLWDEDNVSTRTRCAAIMPGDVAVACPANAYQNSGLTMIPNKIPQDDNGDDLSFPILFGRSTDVTNPGYKGLTTFMQWNGLLRAPGETFAGRTRISLGDVNFPWDGSTPAAS